MSQRRAMDSFRPVMLCSRSVRHHVNYMILTYDIIRTKQDKVDIVYSMYARPGIVTIGLRSPPSRAKTVVSYCFLHTSPPLPTHYRVGIQRHEDHPCSCIYSYHKMFLTTLFKPTCNWYHLVGLSQEYGGRAGHARVVR